MISVEQTRKVRKKRKNAYKNKREREKKGRTRGGGRVKKMGGEERRERTHVSTHIRKELQV